MDGGQPEDSCARSLGSVVTDDENAPLAETVTIGTVVGSYIAPRQSSAPSLPADIVADAEIHFATLAGLTNANGSEDPRAVISDLSEMLWENAGIVRDEERLDDGLAQLDELRERATDIDIDGDRPGEAFEFALDLHFMHPVAEALLRSAKQRTESRGGHYRTDHKEQDDEWQQNLLCSLDDDEMTVETHAVGEPSSLVQAAIEEDHELEYSHLE